jgi:hypothetical protein
LRLDTGPLAVTEDVPLPATERPAIEPKLSVPSTTVNVSWSVAPPESLTLIASTPLKGSGAFSSAFIVAGTVTASEPTTVMLTLDLVVRLSAMSISDRDNVSEPLLFADGV